MERAAAFFVGGIARAGSQGVLFTFGRSALLRVFLTNARFEELMRTLRKMSDTRCDTRCDTRIERGCLRMCLEWCALGGI